MCKDWIKAYFHLHYLLKNAHVHMCMEDKGLTEVLFTILLFWTLCVWFYLSVRNSRFHKYEKSYNTCLSILDDLQLHLFSSTWHSFIFLCGSKELQCVYTAFPLSIQLLMGTQSGCKRGYCEQCCKQPRVWVSPEGHHTGARRVPTYKWYI